ncbi:hypothetical protein [Ancylobacter defluvii]|uniref:hypothetical protein n=1 Tax=Ancylobacter defluvii TaxID=1282440 RepID=UPI0035A21D86
MARISPFLPLTHGVPRGADRRVVSGIVCLVGNGLQYRAAYRRSNVIERMSGRLKNWRRIATR